MDQRRSTMELVQEMKAEALTGKFIVVTIAVGFDDTSLFVSSRDPNALESLNEMVEQGGAPVGLIGITKAGRNGTVETRVFQEFQDQGWAKEYLETLARNFVAELTTSGQGYADDAA